MYLPSIETFLYMLPAFVMAISFHEFAHAWMADRLGDPTARQYGRLTLDPRSHFDLFGFVLFVFAGFGWAKGVPYDSRYFRGNKRMAMILVSLAGVTANMILATLAIIGQCILVFKVASPTYIHSSIYEIFNWIFRYNIIFAIFNLLPIPPLDGSKVIAALLPGDFEEKIAALNPYGFFILIALIYFGWTDRILWPLINKIALGMYQTIVPIFQGGLF